MPSMKSIIYLISSFVKMKMLKGGRYRLCFSRIYLSSLRPCSGIIYCLIIVCKIKSIMARRVDTFSFEYWLRMQKS